MIEGNRKYIRCLYAYNKIDTITIEEVDKLAREPDSIVISVRMKLNLDRLLAKMWDYMGLIRVYTKRRGAPPLFHDPLVLSSERKGVSVEVSQPASQPGRDGGMDECLGEAMDGEGDSRARVVPTPTPRPTIVVICLSSHVSPRPRNKTGGDGEHLEGAARDLQLRARLGPQHQVRPPALRIPARGKITTASGGSTAGLPLCRGGAVGPLDLP